MVVSLVTGISASETASKGASESTFTFLRPAGCVLVV